MIKIRLTTFTKTKLLDVVEMGLNIIPTGADSSGFQLLYFVFHLKRREQSFIMNH